MDDFNKILELAKEKKPSNNLHKHAQVVVALSTSGNIYHKVINNPLTEELIDENSFISELIANQDIQIDKMVCLWANGCVDLLSYNFRKLLCATNSLNGETKMLLQGYNGYIVKTLSQTL